MTAPTVAPGMSSREYRPWRVNLLEAPPVEWILLPDGRKAWFPAPEMVRFVVRHILENE